MACAGIRMLIHANTGPSAILPDFYAVNEQRAFFVVRAKENLKFKRLYSAPKDKQSGIKADQVVALVTPKSKKAYPARLRRVSYFDKKRKQRLVFLSNNFDISATTVAAIYKQRWQVELFFKWVKQHLRIKSFYGTSVTPCRFGSAFASTCWWPSPKNGSKSSAHCTRFYKFLRSIYSRKSQLY